MVGPPAGSDPLRRPAFLAAIDEVETRIRQNRARLARQHRSAALAALPEDLDQPGELWRTSGTWTASAPYSTA